MDRIDTLKKKFYSFIFHDRIVHFILLEMTPEVFLLKTRTPQFIQKVLVSKCCFSFLVSLESYYFEFLKF